jgi:hypothetical protein
MKFTEYLNSKTPKISISIISYRDQLMSEMSRFFKNPEIHDLSILKEAFNSSNYSDKALISLKSGNIQKINEVIDSDQDPELLFDYKESIMTKKISPKIIDKIIEASLQSTESFLQKTYKRIKVALEYLDWNSGDILVDAVSEATANVYIAGNYCFKVTEKQILPEPEISSEVSDLISEMNNAHKTKVLTLYTTAEDSVFEGIKKDLALGFVATIPRNTILTKDSGNWKVKIEEKYLFFSEGLYVLNDDSPVKWIEKNEKQY